MIKNILITGGAGFIGSHLVSRLVTDGYNVRVLDILSPQIHGVYHDVSSLFSGFRDKVDFIRGSVNCRSDLLNALDEVDAVVHLAAETGTGQSMYAIEHYTNVNVSGTALMLDLIANLRFPVKKIVVASSRAVYGEGKYKCKHHGIVFPTSRSSIDMENGDFELHCNLCGSILKHQPSDESTPVSPGSVYAITKLMQEQMVLTVGKALGISVLAFRYQNVYGPGQSLNNPYTGILSIFSNRIRNGKGINIFEDGKESRDFVYIDDVVDVTVKGIEFESPIIDVFNVGSGVETDVLTVANTLQKLLNKSVPTKISGKYRLGDIRHNVAELTKVSNMLGFKPETSMEKGLKQFVAWVNEQEIQNDRYEESLSELRLRGLFK
jgi:dTDP-L-rhamnose 4-epimerase